MEPEHLPDGWRQAHLRERLAVLEGEHYRHEIDRKVGSRLLRDVDGAAAEDARELIRAAEEAQRLIEMTHEVLVSELKQLGDSHPG